MGETSIGRAISWLARERPDAVALRYGEEILTRRELDDTTNRIARRWIIGGVSVDDLVTISLSRPIDIVLASVAAWKAGATPMPLSPTLAPGERASLLSLSGPGWLVDGALDLSTDDSAAPLPELAASCWKAATTSGSTGRSKIVRSTSPARIDPTRPVTAFIPQEAVQLVAGPLHHAAPFTYALRGLMTGHELVLMPRFEASDWLRLVAGHHVTWGMLVPAMMQQIARVPDRASYDVSSLESVLHLGARCPAWLKRDWIDWLGAERVVELYAGAEAQGLALIRGDDWLTHPGSVGRGVGGSRFRVVRPDGSPCDPDEMGEVLMRRDHPTYTYVGAEDTSRDGWHTLGDSGRVDAEGYLYLGDRLEDLVTIGQDTEGQVTVQPADVEAVLDEHPQVRASVVVGRVDPEAPQLGEQLHAVVETEASIAELETWVAERLDPAERPRSWQRVDVALRDAAGKVRRSDWRVPSTADQVSAAAEPRAL